MKKRIISLALSAAMLFAGLSISAFAEEPLTEAEPAAAETVEEENSLFSKSDKTAETTETAETTDTTDEETAAQSEEPEEDKQIRYVALGDSICSGVGLTNVPYAHNLMGVDVSFNFKGYPENCYVGQVAKTLGLDRDSGLVANLFDERDPAVKMLLSMAISAANKMGKYIGICGQGPSDHPDLAEWLMDQGISSISLNPDTVVQTWLSLAELNK